MHSIKYQILFFFALNLVARVYTQDIAGSGDTICVESSDVSTTDYPALKTVKVAMQIDADWQCYMGDPTDPRTIQFKADFEALLSGNVHGSTDWIVDVDINNLARSETGKIIIQYDILTLVDSTPAISALVSSKILQLLLLGHLTATIPDLATPVALAVPGTAVVVYYRASTGFFNPVPAARYVCTYYEQADICDSDQSCEEGIDGSPQCVKSSSLNIPLIAGIGIGIGILLIIVAAVCCCCFCNRTPVAAHQYNTNQPTQPYQSAPPKNHYQQPYHNGPHRMA